VRVFPSNGCSGGSKELGRMRIVGVDAGLKKRIRGGEINEFLLKSNSLKPPKA